MASETVGIYNTVYKLGLITPEMKNNTINHIFEIPLQRINQFFFGVNVDMKKYHFDFHRNGLITVHSNIPYVYISKIDIYLSQAYDIIHKMGIKCFPYNYYKYIDMNDKDMLYCTMISTMDQFIGYLESLDTPYSNTILNILKPKMGLEVMVADVLQFNENIEIILKFKKAGSPLFIRMNNDGTSHLSLKLSQEVDSEAEADNHSTLYEHICSELLMDSPTDFIINNIERVCGSREFAEMMVNSYMNKDEQSTPIEMVASVILWKNETRMEKYIEYFKSRYNTMNDCIDFEGVNKFFLNITEEYVANFEVKEQINTMYYLAMKELIHSYEVLYNNKI
jgi:hypothetical protein